MELTKGTGLGISYSIPRHTRLFLGSAPSHLDHPQALPQVLDLDRGGREATTRQVALMLQSQYVRDDFPGTGLRGGS